MEMTHGKLFSTPLESSLGLDLVFPVLVNPLRAGPARAVVQPIANGLSSRRRRSLDETCSGGDFCSRMPSKRHRPHDTPPYIACFDYVFWWLFQAPVSVHLNGPSYVYMYMRVDRSQLALSEV